MSRPAVSKARGALVAVIDTSGSGRPAVAATRPGESAPNERIELGVRTKVSPRNHSSPRAPYTSAREREEGDASPRAGARYETPRVEKGPSAQLRGHTSRKEPVSRTLPGFYPDGCLDIWLMSVRDELERRLAEIPGVIRRPSRKGHGHTYSVGDREIAHFHGDQRLDVRLTREWIRRRVSERPFDERVHTRGPSADWVAVSVVGDQDLTLALSLVGEAVRANLEENDRAHLEGRGR